MKLIYCETIRKNSRSPYKAIYAYYPTSFEPYGLPALIHLEVGHYHPDCPNYEEADSTEWVMVSASPGNPLTEAQVIRRAIVLVDEKKPG